MGILKVIIPLLVIFHVSYAIQFAWSSKNGVQCIANDTMLGLCSKERDILCLVKGNGQPVPDYYCRHSSVATKPVSHVSCASKECTQRCIMSTWSQWNLCDPACVVSLKYRTRSMLWRASKDDQCPSLIEKETCAHCRNMSDKETYLWQVGKWGTCRQFTTISVLQGSNTTVVSDGSRLCGATMKLGKVTRRVSCVDSKKGQKLNTRKCMNSKDKYGRITQRPDKHKVCHLPCDCHLSQWSTWSVCPRDCSVTEAYRTRDVLYAARLDGKPCGDLVEKRPCTAQNCGITKWYGTPWGRCETQDVPGSHNVPLICGYGYQTRSHVLCMRSNGKAMEPVSDEDCDPKMRLPLRKACMLPCPINCTVNDWQPWEDCSVSCGGLGTRKRVRTVLKRASDGGAECPHLVEISPCGHSYCSKWYKGMWSMCLDGGRCRKPGIKVRGTYCKSPWGYISPKNCSHLPKPARRANCSNPCGNDCALSDWSDWGPCSISCGILGGTQKRYKTILAYPKKGNQPCPKSDQLVETQKCNEFTFCEQDSNLMWRSAPWEACIAVVNGTCGESKGYRKRMVTCGSVTNSTLDESLCAGIAKPVTQEACKVTCEKDCILSMWQKWSECNQACGDPGAQTRRRFVVQNPTPAGTGCPLGTNNDVQLEIRQCSQRLSCYQYEWVAGNWSICTLLRLSENCGAGYHTRTISCVRSDGRVVAPLYCYKTLLTLPPRAIKECWKPCAQSCVRSAWSSWSACPQTCTEGKTPVYRQMYRTVVGLNPARGGFSTTCPDLKSIDFFSEKELCPTLPCITFKWSAGPWQSCIQTGDCSQGAKGREVLCLRNDGVITSDRYCDNTTKPLSREQCSPVCSHDCIVGKWKPWSACAEPCGDSIQVRNRSVISPKVSLGRDCPILTEKRLCRQTPCIDYQWSVTHWSTCKATITGSLCGSGSQKRQVLCKPDNTRQDICLRQSPKPATMQRCWLPCSGDCVSSNWGPWTDCMNGWKGCKRDRWRGVVRTPVPITGKQCSNITKQSLTCECPEAGNWVVSNWTSCQLSNTKDMMCGAGIQFRSSQCIGSKGELLSDIHCSRTRPTTSQKCATDCPVDCVLSGWNVWSKCPNKCGGDRITNRTRMVLVDGIHGGQTCPDSSGLVQTKPCSTMPCGGYTLDEGRWSKCYIDGQGCGYGTKTREAVCRGSDGLPVELYHCLKDGNRFSSDLSQLDKLQILDIILNNITKFSVTLKQPCTDPCPGNCVYTDWSEWSKCGRSCFDKSGKPYQSRTRIIITQAAAGGRACPTNLFESNECQTSEPCIGADWKAASWQVNGTRDVWCETTNAVRVSEACVMKTKPSSAKLCIPACKDPNAHCQDGVCVCKPSYESFQNECVPNNGCVHDKHCVYPNTACINDRCKCKKGYAINATTGDCEWLPVLQVVSTVKSTISTTEMVDTEENEISTNKPTTTESSGGVEKEFYDSDDTVPADYMKWIGISVGVLLFCILLVIGVFCYTRKYKKGKKKKYNPERPKSIELIGLQSIRADDSSPAKV